jgi:hypothetical protein
MSLSKKVRRYRRIQAWRCSCGRPECTSTIVGMGDDAKIQCAVSLEPEEAANLAAQIVMAIPASGHG